MASREVPEVPSQRFVIIDVYSPRPAMPHKSLTDEQILVLRVVKTRTDATRILTSHRDDVLALSELGYVRADGDDLFLTVAGTRVLEGVDEAWKDQSRRRSA